MSSSKDHSKPVEKITLQVNEKTSGKRLDAALKVLLPYKSRTFFQKKIDDGDVYLNGKKTRASFRLQLDDVITIHVGPNPHWVDPQEIPLNIIEEREDCIVLNKEPHQLVHPTGMYQGGTLLNALHARHHLKKYPAEKLPRVIHRLDQETSGVILFATGALAAGHYGQAFENRLTSKVYLAILEGAITQPFVVDEPIGNDKNHPVHVRQWVTSQGKEAHSHFFPLGGNGQLTLCAVKIYSGRLHQIRVHAAYSNFPIYGDPLYNPRDEDYTRWIDWQEPSPKPGRPNRQLLHAWRLNLPDLEKKELKFQASIPNDFRQWAPELITDWENKGSLI